jgi:hypothetical protein
MAVRPFFLATLAWPDGTVALVVVELALPEPQPISATSVAAITASAAVRTRPTTSPTIRACAHAGIA